jgi:hypothetical protein
LFTAGTKRLEKAAPFLGELGQLFFSVLGVAGGESLFALQRAQEVQKILLL